MSPSARVHLFGLIAVLVSMWPWQAYATSSGLSDFAVYATGTGCGAITISGNSYIDSFDSSIGSYSQTRQTSAGVIGANGNVNVSGSVIVNGPIVALNTGVGTCQNGTPGITLSGRAKVTGGYIQLSAPLPRLPMFTVCDGGMLSVVALNVTPEVSTARLAG